jgi:hypothetical protein
MMMRLMQAAVLVTVLGVGPCGPVAAQPSGNTSGDRQGAPQPAGGLETGEPVPLVTLEFPGGSLAEYVEEVRRRLSAPANIVVSGPAEEVPMPPMALRAVHVQTALEIPTREGRTQIGERTYYTALRTFPGRDGGTSVYAVVVQAQQPGRTAPPAASDAARAGEQMQHTEVFALRELLEARTKPETILSAVEAALGLDRDGPEAALRFHEPSALLIVRGTSTQVAAVHRVMMELRGSVGRELAERRRREALEQEQHIRLELQNLYREMVGARLAFDDARRTAMDMGLFGDGVLPGVSKLPPEDQRRINAARSAVLEAELRIEELRRETERLEQVLTELTMHRLTGRPAAAPRPASAPPQPVQPQNPEGEQPR